MSTLSSLVSALKSAGASSSTIQSAVQAIAGASPTSTIQSICTIILANSNDPAVIKDEATKLAEVPNLPTAVANLVPQLEAAANANNPMQVIQVVQAIETAIGGTGLNLGSLF